MGSKIGDGLSARPKNFLFAISLDRVGFDDFTLCYKKNDSYQLQVTSGW